MRGNSDFEGLEALIAERGNALLATAILLTGSRAAGEDLLQTALEKVMRRWNRIDSDDKEGYLRRTLYHLAIDQWRSKRSRREVLIDAEPAGQADGTETLHLRQALVQALMTLPPRSRAVLVLRYWEQLTEAQTAETLGCSVGTVKSTASRALARLREATADWDLEYAQAGRGTTR